MIKSLEMDIWGRKFKLPVEYDCYKGEKVTKEQRNAVKVFTEHPEWIEDSKTAVEKYCKKAVVEDVDNDKKANIFSYVVPEHLYVTRAAPCVVLMCRYKYDLEHGLAVMYSSSGEVDVCIQDEIL